MMGQAIAGFERPAPDVRSSRNWQGGRLTQKHLQSIFHRVMGSLYLAIVDSHLLGVPIVRNTCLTAGAILCGLAAMATIVVARRSASRGIRLQFLPLALILPPYSTVLAQGSGKAASSLPKALEQLSDALASHQTVTKSTGTKVSTVFDKLIRTLEKDRSISIADRTLVVKDLRAAKGNSSRTEPGVRTSRFNQLMHLISSRCEGRITPFWTCS